MSWSTSWPMSRCWRSSWVCRCPASPRSPMTTRAAPRQAHARHTGRSSANAVTELEAAAEATTTEVRPAARPVSTSRSTCGAGRAPTWMALLVHTFRDVDPRRRHPSGDRSRHGGPPAGVAAHDGPRRLRPRAENARRPGCLPAGPTRPVPLHRPRRRRLGRRSRSGWRSPTGGRRHGRRRDRHHRPPPSAGASAPGSTPASWPTTSSATNCWPTTSSTPSRPSRCSDRLT